MAYHLNGKAIFSTYNGEYLRREKLPTMRIILRSHPLEDQQTMVSKLRKDFPEACKAITRPVKDTDVYEYFDYCDAAVQGFEFLRAVLDYIARLNESVNAKKALKIQDYVGCWENANSEAFIYVRPYHAVADLFTKEDIQEHGVEFLTEAMKQIKHARLQEDSAEARQSALRLQMQHAQMMHNQGNFTQLPAVPAPPSPPFSITVSAQSVRASSNPEPSASQLQGGQIRHLPGSPGQFSAPQGRLPLQRLTPSTQDLEHIHPGSTSRGDFHSDPTSHNAIDTYRSAPPSNCIAIPSRGLPGPYTYRPLPPQVHRVPLLSHGNLPKGKRNPKKQSSDDARLASNTENSPWQAPNSADPQWPFPLQNVQLPFCSKSPDAMTLAQELQSASGDMPDVNLPQGFISANRQETVRHSSYHRQIPMQSATGGRCRVVSNPYSSPAPQLQAPIQDPCPGVTAPSMPPNVQHKGIIARRRVLEEHPNFISTQKRPHISQSLDPHAFRHQPPDYRFDAEGPQDPDPKTQRLALASMSNASQTPVSELSERSKANDFFRRPIQEGCTIWIGGIPKGFNRAAVMHLLKPCRGFVDVSEPKVSSQPKDPVKLSYAFADFQNPIDAAEALERLPKTRFASLPDGTFLRTNYPKSKPHLSLRHHQYGGEGHPRWPNFDIPPTKSCNGEDPNRAGHSKFHYSHNLSRGSTSVKEPSTSSFKGDSRNPSERAIAVEAGRQVSDSQPEEACANPYPHDTSESIIHMSQPSANGQQGLKPMNQDPTTVEPDVRVESHANDASRITDDGYQETMSVPIATPRVRKSHQSPGSKHLGGREKAPKKKSKGSNKLPVPETKESKNPIIDASLQNSKPTTSATPPASDIYNPPNGHSEEKRKQRGSEMEAGDMKAPTVPLDTMSTPQKDPKSSDRSFLGRNPTEDDGEHPKASVAYTIITEVAKTEAEASRIASVQVPGDPTVSAAPLEQPEGSVSQAVRRDISISTQGAAYTLFSLSFTPPPCGSKTERSNSITEEMLSPKAQVNASSLEPIKFLEASEPGETALEQKAETPKGLAPSGTIQDTMRVQGGSKDLTDGELGELRPSLKNNDPQERPITSSIQLSSPQTGQEPPQSSVSKGAPSIPARSSSLAAPSAPIKTHRKKKKPRKLTPIGEAPSEDDLGSSTKVRVDGTKMDSNKQATEGTKTIQPILIVDTTAPTLTADKWKGLPKPETPFVMDDGVRVAPPMISRHTVTDVSNADRYYALKKEYQVAHLASAMHFSATFGIDSPNSTSPLSLDTKTPNCASANEQIIDLETTLREAGFRGLSDSSPFIIKDPELALFEAIVEEEHPLEKRTNSGGTMVSSIDDKIKLGSGMSLDALIKQNEIMEIVEKAAAVKQILAGPPPWTKIESQRQQLLRFITHFFSHAQEQQIANSQPPQTSLAKSLLDTVPERDSSTSELQNWSAKVLRFMAENVSETSSTCRQYLKRTTNNLSKSTRRTPSWQQQQERRHRVLINKPDPQILARKSGRDNDTFQSADTELSDSVISTESELSPSTFGRRTPSEERPTTSLNPAPSAALNQVSKLDDLFGEMGKEHRSWSDGRQRLSTTQEEERMMSSDPETKPLEAEFDVRRVTEVKNVEPESDVKDTENEGWQKPHEERQSNSRVKELAGEDEMEDRNISAKPDGNADPASTESKQEAIAKAENIPHQKQTFHPLGVSTSSFDSSVTTSSARDSEESDCNQPRGAHSPLKRSGYNAVAGRGTDAKRGGGKEESQDPWALPQGEQPWGGRGKVRGEKKRRQRQ